MSVHTKMNICKPHHANITSHNITVLLSFKFQIVDYHKLILMVERVAEKVVERGEIDYLVAELDSCEMAVVQVG